MTTDETYKPGLEGVVAGKTKISYVNSELCSLMYRGVDIRDFVENGTYEEAAYLLLFGDLPNAQELKTFTTLLKEERNVAPEVVETLKLIPQHADMMDALRAGVSHFALHDADYGDNSHEANLRKATRLVAKIPVIVAYTYRLTTGQELIHPDNSLNHAENFLYMVFGEKPTPLAAKAFDQTLICYAEHGFNASTFAGRVTTSTLSDIHSGVISAIGALKGPLHGGANEEAMKMLLEIGAPENAEAWVNKALSEKRRLMGFGHRQYKSGDPRARVIKELARQVGEQLGQPQWHQTACTIEEIVVKEKGLYPNVDLPAGYLYYMLGLPIETYTPIFALARVAGWTAHIMEQHDGNRLIRPKAIYEGPDRRPYTPISER